MYQKTQPNKQLNFEKYEERLTTKGWVGRRVACSKTHSRQSHCVVSLSKILYPLVLLITSSTQEDRKLSHGRKILDGDTKSSLMKAERTCKSYCP